MAAIEDRDLDRAAAAMRAHLENVERNLLRSRPAPEPLMPEVRETAVRAGPDRRPRLTAQQRIGGMPVSGAWPHTRPSPASAETRKIAGAARCTGMQRRPCSARGRSTRPSCWWASSQAIRRICRAARSSDRPARSWTSALADAGIDRSAVYVTNAVKHFKFEPRGKRRLHKKPNAGEIEACKWWLDQELEVIKPEL